jgi:carbonic anhydrase
MPDAITPAEALRRLREGNQRFVSELTSMRSRLSATQEMRAHLAVRQTPFATVVSCSDSRVPSEIIFDQGLGDLFMIRNAGAVGGHAPLASIEFAVGQLATPLVVALAHERCGALRATYDALTGAPAASASLAHLVERLRPALDAAGEHGAPEERCDRAARIQVLLLALDVARSPVIEPLLREGRVAVVPAYYRIAAGNVEFSEPLEPDEIAPGSTRISERIERITRRGSG